MLKEIDNLMAGREMQIIEPLKSEWKVAPFIDEQILVFLPTRPSLWYRIWMRVFFGWRFEKIDAKN